MGRPKKQNSATSPAHYKQGGLEVITIWKKKLTPEEFRGACKANITKYLFRAEQKNGVEDYKKAAVYLQWLIEAEEEERARKARLARREAKKLDSQLDPTKGVTQ